MSGIKINDKEIKSGVEISQPRFHVTAGAQREERENVTLVDTLAETHDSKLDLY